jgi:hypothetical protein
VTNWAYLNDQIDLEASATVRVTCVKNDETAWGFGTRYTRSNWAMFSTYAPDTTINFIAGQNYVAGTIHFSPVVNGEVQITITLVDGWIFSPFTSENLKIQPYSSPPTGNPSPGRFQYKYDVYVYDPDGKTITITLPYAPYYGIHGDLLDMWR